MLDSRSFEDDAELGCSDDCILVCQAFRVKLAGWTARRARKGREKRGMAGFCSGGTRLGDNDHDELETLDDELEVLAEVGQRGRNLAARDWPCLV